MGCGGIVKFVNNTQEVLVVKNKIIIDYSYKVVITDDFTDCNYVSIQFDTDFGRVKIVFGTSKCYTVMSSMMT
jgi:hypothetical protein